MTPDRKSEYRLIPWIFEHFHNYLLKPENSIFIWELDAARLLYTVKNKQGAILATVDINLSSEKYSGNENATEHFNFGFNCSENLLESVKISILQELQLLIGRMQKLEERFHEVYDRFFPRDPHGLIDWDRCPLQSQAAASKHSENRRIDLHGGLCGLNCVFCSVPIKMEKNSPAVTQLLQYEQLCTAAFEIGSAAADGLWLQFFSTDPISHPDIVSLVRLGKKVGYAHISIATAMMHELSGGLLDELAEAGLDALDIPIYGVTAKTNDAITGRPGHFDCLKIVSQKASKLDITIKFHSVALNINLKELEAIPALAEKLGGHFFNFLYVRYHGDSRLPVHDLMPRLSDLTLKVRHYLNLRIPCLEAGSQFSDEKQSSASIEESIRQGRDAHLDRQYEFEYAAKCGTCAKRRECSGVFPPYLDVFGDGEFKPFK